MYDKENDIEYLLKQDAREKKRTGSGVFSRASRRGYTGAVRTQVDYLKGKAKKEYMKSGEIKVSNIYDDINKIPSIEELRGMDKEVGKNIITYARTKHKIKDLANHWGFSDNYLYSKFFPEFGITARKYSNRVTGNRYTKKEVPFENAPVMYTEPSTASVTMPDDVFELKYTALNATGDNIVKRLTDYLTVLEADKQYEIKFTVREVK